MALTGALTILARTHLRTAQRIGWRMQRWLRLGRQRPADGAAGLAQHIRDALKVDVIMPSRHLAKPAHSAA